MSKPAIYKGGLHSETRRFERPVWIRKIANRSTRCVVESGSGPLGNPCIKLRTSETPRTTQLKPRYLAFLSKPVNSSLVSSYLRSDFVERRNFAISGNHYLFHKDSLQCEPPPNLANLPHYIVVHQRHVRWKCKPMEQWFGCKALFQPCSNVIAGAFLPEKRGVVRKHLASCGYLPVN